MEDNVDLNISLKLQFIVEQLQLVFKNTKHYRYFPNLLSICDLCENISSSLYKQIRDEGMLTIPSTKYIKKLTAALSVDTGLPENTIKYLEARCQKPPNPEEVPCSC